MLKSLQSLVWQEIDQQELITDFIYEISDAIWNEDIGAIELLRSHITEKNYIFVLFKAPYDVMFNALNCDDSRIFLTVVKGLTSDELRELFKLVVANAHRSIFRKHASAIKSLLFTAENHQDWLELLAVRMKNGQTPIYYAQCQSDQASLKVFTEGLSEDELGDIQMMTHSSTDLIFSDRAVNYSLNPSLSEVLAEGTGILKKCGSRSITS